jgi:glycosyltransferase involved in cell wall biosynthesis
MATEAAAADSRVRLVSEPDKGVYDAMNKGIASARGQWVYFLGSDDLLHDNTVFSFVFGLPGNDQVDLLYGNVVGPSYKGVYDGEFDLDKLLVRNISHQAIFYRRSVLERLGGYNLRYRGYADWELNIRCYKEGIRMRYVDRIIGRFGPGGLSSRHDVPFLQEILLPERLRRLSAAGLKPLRRIMVYDDWWRLVRNAGLRDPAVLQRFAGEQPVPLPIARMAAWQRRIAPQLLTMGVISKGIMFISYFFHRHLLR